MLVDDGVGFVLYLITAAFIQSSTAPLLIGAVAGACVWALIPKAE